MNNLTTTYQNEWCKQFWEEKTQYYPKRCCIKKAMDCMTDSISWPKDNTIIESDNYYCNHCTIKYDNGRWKCLPFRVDGNYAPIDVAKICDKMKKINFDKLFWGMEKTTESTKMIATAPRHPGGRPLGAKNKPKIIICCQSCGHTGSVKFNKRLICSHCGSTQRAEKKVWGEKAQEIVNVEKPERVVQTSQTARKWKAAYDAVRELGIKI